MIKKYKCVVCFKTFEVIGQKYNGFFRPNHSPFNIKMCSDKCRSEKQKQNSEEQRNRKKKIIISRKCRFCGDKILSNAYNIQNFCGGVSGKCYRNYLSKTRKGKNNPAYRNGLRVNNNKKTYSGKHLYACKTYRKSFLEKWQFPFCEVCKVNQNGTMKFEVHHIYFASIYPKHKELHNPRNLIHICIECHNKFHAGKVYEKVFKKLEAKRGLKELFNG